MAIGHAKHLPRVPRALPARLWRTTRGSPTVILALAMVALLGVHVSWHSGLPWSRRQVKDKDNVPAWDRDIAFIGQVNTGCESQGPSSGLYFQPSPQLVAPVVVVAHDRPQYLAKALVSLLRYRSNDPAGSGKFPIFVSIDGSHMQTTQLALSFNFTAGVQVIRNLRAPSCARDEGSWDHRCSLSMHYLMLVHLFFECLDSPRLIFVEEDLEVAPDFFSYFQATVPLLQQDDSIFCISAWNDHGQRGRASNSTALLRTDVMPGLGWMLSADRARMVMPGWINSSTQQMGWDEYLRNPCVRNDMQCVFPEVSRTHTFGKVGTHGGIFFDDHFGNMVLNDEAIDWTKMDLSYLHKDKYAGIMQAQIAAAVRMRLKDYSSNSTELGAYCNSTLPPMPEARSGQDLKLFYNSYDQLGHYTNQLAPMMTDISTGGKVPRASYNGTVMVRCRGRRLFLVANYSDPGLTCKSWTAHITKQG